MALVGILAMSGNAAAMDINTGSRDFTLRWDNTLQYNLGMRAQPINSKIGNNPIFDESDHKFKQGDLVTNRLGLLSELDAAYMRAIGVRVSGSGWYDFAYTDKVKFAPGEVAPGVPYSALGSYDNDKYSAYTKRFYIAGAQLLDAFAWVNFDMGPVPTSLKVGRLAQTWGTALFFAPQSIQYSQNASDNIKGAAAPGTLAKELAIPRLQALAQFQILPELSIAGQYFGEFQGNRLPEGGTFLGLADFLFSGPDRLVTGTGVLRHGEDVKPDAFNDNFGVRLNWAPSWADGGSFGAYFRHFDETQPWAPLIGVDAGGNANYHLAYAKGVNAVGLSAETQIAGLSLGLEGSYRQKTALNSATGPLPTDLVGHEGARGDTVNAVANIIQLLTKNFLWDTGQLIVEAAYTHLVKVTDNKDLYNGTKNALACPSGSKLDGCSTDNAVTAAILFTPQWLGVLPGLDLDLPLFAMYGVTGNTPSLAVPVNEGSLTWSAGVHALYRRAYNLTLQYNGYHSNTHGGLTDAAGGAVPGLPQWYRSGNGTFQWNDRGWVSLTFSTTL